MAHQEVRHALDEDDTHERTPKLYRTLPDPALEYDRAVHALQHQSSNRGQVAEMPLARGLLGAPGEESRPPFLSPPHRARSRRPAVGIRHQRIEPGRTEQNGRHARMHRTFKAEATRPPERNQATQRARFDRICREYNHERPHEALGQRTPASRYHASQRRMPAKLAEPEYPGHGLGRRISHAGTFRFKSRPLFLSDTLLQEWVALEETGDGMWSICFYDVLLARVDA
jgi:transposase InsO family protein